jgi:hypothetical protein
MLSKTGRVEGSDCWYHGLSMYRVMSTGGQGSIIVDGEEIRTVTSYKFVGALIINDGYIHDEIKRTITLGKAATANLTTIMKDS